jgi:glycerate 2-kinase
VVNPLLGPEGAASVFAPQKGANPRQCQILEQGLQHVSQLLIQDRGLDYSALPGVGAAGGLAYGLHHLPRAGIMSGSQWIAEQLDLLDKIQRADVIITGEGRFDATSFSGKATGNVLVWALNKPVFILCGQVQEHLDTLGQVAVYPLVQAGEPEHSAIAQPETALLQRLEQLLPALLEKLA